MVTVAESDTVRVARSQSRSAYHTDPECHLWPDNGTDVPRETAEENMGLSECQFCAGTFEPESRNQQDVYPELHADTPAPTLQ